MGGQLVSHLTLHYCTVWQSGGWAHLSNIDPLQKGEEEKKIINGPEGKVHENQEREELHGSLSK